MKFIFLISFVFCFVMQSMAKPASNTEEIPAASPSYSNIFNNDLQRFIDVEIKNKKYITSGLGTFIENQNFIREQLRKYDLPDSLQYLPLALTYKNQAGLDNYNTAGFWNLSMPVAIKYGLTVNNIIDERFDIKKSGIAAVKYLKDLSDLYHQDYTQVLLAYISSPSELGTICHKYTQYHSPLSFSDYYYSNLYNKECIPAYFASMEIVKNTEYTPKIQQYFSTSIAKPVSIEALAEYGIISKEEFGVLNPIIRSNIVFPYNNIILNFPLDKENRFRTYEDSLYVRTYQLLNPPVRINENSSVIVNKNPNNIKPATKSTTYTVRQGDYLGKIADKYNVGIVQLKKWNNLKSDKISIGQKLIIKKSGN